jgi:hypothetical protein
MTRNDDDDQKSRFRIGGLDTRMTRSDTDTIYNYFTTVKNAWAVDLLRMKVDGVSIWLPSKQNAFIGTASATI